MYLVYPWVKPIDLTEVHSLHHWFTILVVFLVLVEWYHAHPIDAGGCSRGPFETNVKLQHVQQKVGIRSSVCLQMWFPGSSWCWFSYRSTSSANRLCLVEEYLQPIDNGLAWLDNSPGTPIPSGSIGSSQTETVIPPEETSHVYRKQEENQRINKTGDRVQSCIPSFWLIESAVISEENKTEKIQW